jgi:glycosyltransferase involved in cell wall biosynthesis
MKIRMAFLHDYFNARGGGERVALYFSRYKPDYYTYFFDETKTYNELKNMNIITPKNHIKTSFLRQISCIRYFKKLKLNPKDYDIFIMTGFYSIFASRYNHPNIWYTYGPSKTLLLTKYFNQEKLLRKISVLLWRRITLGENTKFVKSYVDKIIAISKYASERTEKLYGRDAEVLYLPVDVKKFYNKPAEDFYLTVSRLEPNKRINLIVEAFKKMPDKKIIIVGDGSQRKYLEKLAEGHKNIIFYGSVDEKTLLDLYSRCIAFIFVPMLEDFGLVVLEAMASGKPVITVNEGGPKEIVINKHTGLIINPSESELIKAVRFLTKEKAEDMKKNCLKRVREFSMESFFKKMDKIIEETINNY